MDRAEIARLLRKFEPVIRFTSGERFFPMDVAPYVERAGLWVRNDRRPSRCLVAPGGLSLETLGEIPPIESGQIQFLRSTEPLSAKELATHALKEKRRKKDDREIFHAGRGRLARVGYTSRLLDALFSLSLFTRGRVPGDLATAATIAYGELSERPHTHPYYGRAVRRDGWIVLQYWFFYFFNDWRSRFFGTNDHEGDWEMISIFLDENAPGGPAPEWVVYSCHEYDGVDLRRRWDDDEVETIGDHPVVYAGAGSHASYFRAGEYLAEIELPAVRPAARVVDAARKLWHEKLRQYGTPLGDETETGPTGLFRVPFVDYARGDGYAIGPGQEFGWDEPVILSPPPPWVAGYRGLWGYYAQDPLSGEDAPAGPMYNRDGTVRAAWNDPVGWCGLTGVPAPSQALAHTVELRSFLERRRRDRLERAEADRRELLRIEVESRSIAGRPHLQRRGQELHEEAERFTREIAALRSEIASDEATIEALEDHTRALGRGEKGPARAHIRRFFRPFTPDQLRAGRFAETWAAASVGFLLIAVGAFCFLAREYLVVGLASLAFWFVVIELTFRGKLTQLVTFCSVLLALVAGVVLIARFFVPIALTVVVAVGVYILWENLRELWT